MIISLIVAMDCDHGISREGKIPWHLHRDLQRFKRLTMGHYLVMGRKTFESIGKPLPGRVSIVLTRNENYHAYGCIIAHSLDEAIKIAKRNDEQELFVIGGGDIYRQALPLTDKIYLTSVETRVDTDTYFPMLLDSDWKVKESEKFEKSEQDEYPSEFKILERNH